MLQVRMLHTPEVPDLAFTGAFFGMEELVRELTGYPPDVHDYGHDTDWLRQFWVPERQQLGVHGPLMLLETEHGKYDGDPHIDVVLTTDDLCDTNNPEPNFCLGVACGRSVIVSVYHFLPFYNRGEEETFHELLKQETAHELGHVLKLAVREHSTYEALGTHCADPLCLMHQGLTVPTDWLDMVQYRLQRSGRYACDLCHTDARNNGML